MFTRAPGQASRPPLGSAPDSARLVGEPGPFLKELPRRILAHLELLRAESMNEVSGERLFVDRYHHSLQTATRALRDGADEELTACALLHDIGDILGSCDHAAVAAAIVEPFVSERNHWMVRNHARLQRHAFVTSDGVHFEHYIGLDQEVCRSLSGHPHLEYTMHFCNEYDQQAYDPRYDTLPMEDFVPIIEGVFHHSRARCFA